MWTCNLANVTVGSFFYVFKTINFEAVPIKGRQRTKDYSPVLLVGRRSVEASFY